LDEGGVGRKYLTNLYTEEHLPAQLGRWGLALISAVFVEYWSVHQCPAMPPSCLQSFSSILSGAPCLYASSDTGPLAPDLVEKMRNDCASEPLLRIL
jgi:hypothetical protein